MSRLQKWLLWGSSILTGLTGLVYWWMRYALEPVDELAVVGHPLEPYVLKAHIVVAPVLVFAVGLIALEHVWKHIRAGVATGRRSGFALVWLITPMILSGYLIQAVTAPRWLSALGWIHLGTGVLYLAGMGAHAVAIWGRGRSRAAGRAAPPPRARSGRPAAGAAAGAGLGDPPGERGRPRASLHHARRRS